MLITDKEPHRANRIYRAAMQAALDKKLCLSEAAESGKDGKLLVLRVFPLTELIYGSKKKALKKTRQFAAEMGAIPPPLSRG